MLCFRGGTKRSGESPTSSPHPPPPSAQSHTLTLGATEEKGGGDENWRRRLRSDGSPTSSSAQTSGSATASASPTTSATANTINLKREYTLSVQTNSYNEIWSKIHHSSSPPPLPVQVDGEGEEVAVSTSAHLIARVLQPDRDSIQQALNGARPTHLTRLVSRYLDSSEHTSHLFLSLRRSVDRARSIYSPITDLLDLLPSSSASADLHPPTSYLSQAQCDWAFDTFQEFDRLDNPFPAPTAAGDESCNFVGIRHCFAELKQQLDIRLLKARRRHRLFRRVTHGSAACLIASVTAAALTGLVIATHALAALVAGPALCLPLPLPSRDLLSEHRRRLREHMALVDAAARETYVLNNNLDTIERLVARLHAAVESDKGLVRLGLQRGRGQRHTIQEVVRHLRKTHPSFLHQLRDLDEHICLCFAAVNRARSLLFQQIHHG